MAVDLFASLASLGKKRDMEWYTKLSEADKKTIHPFVVARWLTGTSDAAQIVRINAFVNPYLFSLGDDKDLLFRLLAAASTGSTSRYQWIKGPSAANTGGLAMKVIADYYEVSMREAKSYLPGIKHDTITEMAEELGWEKDELAKLKKELGNGSGSTEKTGSGKKSPKRK